MPIRAILINPKRKTVEAVELPNGSNATIYDQLGCTDFNMVRVTEADVVFVDGEGLLKKKPGPFFLIGLYDQPLAGKGLVLGIDPAGETVSTHLDLRLVRDNVAWPDVKFVGFKDSTDENVEIRPGIRGTRFRREALFKPRHPIGTGDEA
jgi:hypothetical protein